jgi:uncharacterized protein YcgI (DUF1989 family)
MNVAVEPDGTLRVLQPRLRPGGFMALRAEMDMLCGLTACKAKQSNIGAFKPIDYGIVCGP